MDVLGASVYPAADGLQYPRSLPQLESMRLCAETTQPESPSRRGDGTPDPSHLRMGTQVGQTGTGTQVGQTGTGDRSQGLSQKQPGGAASHN